MLPKFLRAVSPLAVMSVKISVISEYKYLSPPIIQICHLNKCKVGQSEGWLRWAKRGVRAIRVCGIPRGCVGGYHLN